MKKIIEKIKTMGLNKILVSIIIILIALAVAQGLFLSGKGISGGRTISLKNATDLAMSFINNKLIQGDTKASLVDSKEENGVYRINIKIGEQQYASYITKNGKIFFPEGVEIPKDVSANTDTSNTQGSQTQQDIEKRDKAEANLFIMSFCPYGNQAEELMIPVVDLLKGKADIKLHYVIYSNYQGGGPNYCLDKENKYCSMHGIQEVNQDVRELCVQKYQGDKFWNFVKQINASCTAQNVDTCWEGVASTTGIDTNKIKTCQKKEAVTLLQNEVELGKKYGISGSPQLIINDVEYQGNRSAEGFKAAICSGFNTAPSECSTTLSTGSGTTPSGGCETP